MDEQEIWAQFREFVEQNKDLPERLNVHAGNLPRRTPAADDVIAAYDAPFLRYGVEGGDARRAALDSPSRPNPRRRPACSTRSSTKLPTIQIVGQSDIFLTPVTAERFTASIGRQVDELIPSAGHALPEDQGPLLGERIAAWLADLPETRES